MFVVILGYILYTLKIFPWKNFYFRFYRKYRQSSLQIINLDKKSFNIILLSANSNYREIVHQINLYRPLYFVVTDFFVYNKVKRKIKNKKTKILNKFDNVPFKLKFDITIAAIVGIAGLEPTMQFAKQSKKLL